MSRYLPLLALGLLGLTACGGLNTQKIADTIQQDILSKGGNSLQSVACPNGVTPEANKSFVCVGTVDNGYTFTIPVQQQDDKGTVTWDVPHAKGLLNIPKLETTMQAALVKELSTEPLVSCGEATYRSVKPGEGFNCQLTYQSARSKATAKQVAATTAGTRTKSAKVTEKIAVTTTPEGDVSWQRVLPNSATRKAARTGTTAPAGAAPPAEAAATTAPSSAQPTTSAQTPDEDGKLFD